MISAADGEVAVFTAGDVIKELERFGTPKRAKASAWFFKTGKGQYGYGDVFVGVSVPDQRKVAKKYKNLALEEIKTLLAHKIHECRLTALFILVSQYQKGDEKTRDRIAKFYLAHIACVNNWDLVDSSAPYILGDYLLKRPREKLYAFARSKNLWERRIAVLAAGGFIRHGDYADTFKIAEMLLGDGHDLIHKAVGWMLREVGKRSMGQEESFLQEHITRMPRTMLRYAIEKFPEAKRRMYLAMK